MGLLGNYMTVDDTTLDYMVELDNEALLEMIEELEEDESTEIYAIDKLWDGLHFLLTGKSAANPIEDDKLSEAVVGVHVFNDDDEEAEFVGCTENDELPDIVQAMLDVDIDALKEGFDLSKFRDNKIYPNIWLDKDRDSLFNELMGEFKNLPEFYMKAAESGKHIVISIY